MAEDILIVIDIHIADERTEVLCKYGSTGAVYLLLCQARAGPLWRGNTIHPYPTRIQVITATQHVFQYLYRAPDGAESVSMC